jgi:excisionase family DNA binding protein
MAAVRSTSEPASTHLPGLRFAIPEAAQILRLSRAQLYIRISDGAIKAQKDGARTYITRVELERYVESCNGAISHP